MVDGVESLGYGKQNGVEYYGVEGYEKSAEVEGGNYENEMGFGWGFWWERMEGCWNSAEFDGW
jgi:hypothetical protein